MTDISQAEYELIRRYLAKGLSEEGELMVMTRIIRDPRFRQEMEVTAALRDGLRELERSGTLASLLQSPAGLRPRVSLALAAMVLVAVSGGVISYLVSERQHPPASAVESETLRFETARGGASQADVTWRPSGRPVQLEMVFDVGPSPAGSYRVTLRSSAGTQFATTIDQLIETTPDGEVVLLLDGALLAPGNYDVRLEPSSAGRPAAIVTYTLKIHDDPDEGP
jgi:hypothetical protein